MKNKNKIKRIREILTTIGILGIIIGGYVFVCYNDTHYTRTGKIHRVDSFCYRLTDTTGHSFDFYTNDILKDETTITALFNNKGSVSYIYDDEIIDYKIVSDSED